MHMKNETLTEIFPTTSSNTLIDLLALLNRNNKMKLCSLNHFDLISKEISHTQMKRTGSKEMVQNLVVSATGFTPKICRLFINHSSSYI